MRKEINLQTGETTEHQDAPVTWEVTEPTYAEKRASEYPAIGDQLDMLWHAIDSGTLDKTSDFYTTLKEVKDNNPKSGV